MRTQRKGFHCVYTAHVCIYISSHHTQGALHKRTAHQPIREYPLVSAPETPDLEDVSVLAMKPSFSSNQYQHLAMA